MDDQASFSIPKWRKKQIGQLKLPSEQQIYRESEYNISDFEIQQPHGMPLLKEQETIVINNQEFQAKKLEKEKDLDLLVFVLYIKNLIHMKSEDNQKEFTQFKQKLYRLDLCTCAASTIPKRYLSMYSNKILKKIMLQYLKKCELNQDLVELLLRQNQAVYLAVKMIFKTITIKHNEKRDFQLNLNFQKLFEQFSKFFGIDYRPKESIHLFKNFALYLQNQSSVYLLINYVQGKSKQQITVPTMQSPRQPESIRALKYRSIVKAKPEQVKLKQPKSWLVRCLLCFR